MVKDNRYYTIGAVAEILNIHPHTLREYEREELISPMRTSGNIRLYSEDDIEEIRFIREMTQGLGVNLAGVDIILRMKRQIEDLHHIMENVEELVREKIEKENLRKSALTPKKKTSIIKIERVD